MDEMLAIVKLFAGNFAPVGFLDCSGQSLPIQQYQAVYSLLGNNFGGDGVHTFNLPDLRPTDGNGNKRPWNPGELRSIICMNGIYPARP
ncbi:phage tail protein [Chlorobium sp. KB01]|uniref:phage tail protein n=1 Tax=Chlorobium sp. KB01 TaxID=1917528 RepID=UPI0009760836|nr:tail fiber protein [Chlorobium sp. KB01]